MRGYTTFATTLCLPQRTEAPLLETGNLLLRHHILADFDAFWAFYQTDRARYMPIPKTRTHLWYGLSSEIVSWHLRGFGTWALEVEGQLAGQISLMHPPHYPEIELGWTLFEGFEGRGVAFTAAALAREWFWSQSDLPSLVSYIHPDNTRSRALAERLGAKLDPAALLPAGEAPGETVVYRHERPA